MQAVWARTVEYVKGRTADDALIAELEFDGDRDGVLLLRFVDRTSPTAAFIASDVARIERIVASAVGRKIRITLTTSAQAPPPPERVEIDPKIVEHPLVTEAIGLFDATIHSVRSLSSDDSATPESRSEPDGDPKDV